MALITCPECGRENVSSSAVACPTCGFPINQIAVEQMPEKQYEEIWFSQAASKGWDMVILNGLEEGCKGVALQGKRGDNKKDLFSQSYTINNGIISITSDESGNTKEFKIAGDYLLFEKTRYDGNIPNEEHFNARCVLESNGKTTYTFYENGTYNKYMQSSSGNFTINGCYFRKGDIICFYSPKYTDHLSNFPDCYIVYENNLYSFGWICKKRESEVYLDENFAFLSQMPQHIKEYVNSQKRPYTPTYVPPVSNLPKCPSCGGTRVQRITSFDRTMNALAFGLLGNKRKKQFKCLNPRCGYEW